MNFLFLFGNKRTGIADLVAMAKKDREGEDRFARYWYVSLGGNPLTEAAKAQIEELRNNSREVVVK